MMLARYPGKKKEKIPIPSFPKERLHWRILYFVQVARLKQYSQLKIQPRGKTKNHNIT